MEFREFKDRLEFKARLVSKDGQGELESRELLEFKVRLVFKVELASKD